MIQLTFKPAGVNVNRLSNNPALYVNFTLIMSGN